MQFIDEKEKEHYQLPSSPYEKFFQWFNEAREKGEEKHDAFALATTTPQGYPNVRFVLYKGIHEGSFLFFTNYHSPKATELFHTPWAAMAFHWPKLGRQVRIQGKVQKTSFAISEQYFQSRPRGSQVSATASSQGQIVFNRNLLKEKWKRVDESYPAQKALPCPLYWGGLQITPHRMEFWQDCPDRFHDRFLYLPTLAHLEDGPYQEWNIHRLSP